MVLRLIAAVELVIFLDGTVVNIALPSGRRGPAPRRVRPGVGHERVAAGLRRLHAGRRSGGRPARPAANRCRFCIDAHTVLLHAIGEHELAEHLLHERIPPRPGHAALAAWARATRIPDVPLPPRPFPPAGGAHGVCRVAPIRRRDRGRCG